MSLSTSKIRKLCVLCHGEHFVDECRNFLAESIEDKKKFEREKALVLDV